MSRFTATLAFLVVLTCGHSGLGAARAEPVHGIAMHGAPALPRDFAHLPYANPAAPKGGRITLGVIGSFDNLNPLIVKGEPVAGVRDYVVESLMARSIDEPFALYGLVAEAVEVPADRSSITFHINPAARFSDGQPVTAADVLFSMAVLRRVGRPNHRTYFRKIASAEALTARSVRFSFKPADPVAGQPPAPGPVYDREMPLIMGLMPVLPRHLIDRRKFDKTTLEPIVGSGPYRIAKVDAGRSITYKRDPGYWGRDLPVMRGRFNFDEIRFDYYRDGATYLEAFKVGQIDLRTEDDPAQWAESARYPMVRDGRMIRAEIPTRLPAGMAALVFNTRRPVFQDRRVREALIQLFNFEWTNRTLFHNLYRRTQSYFERSELASLGPVPPRPADARERALIEKHKARVEPVILEGTYRFPVSDGTGHNRKNARGALDLLESAGYVLDDGLLVHKETRKPFEFEILAASQAQERLFSNFVADLRKLGIVARLRVVDSAQFQRRIKSYDYDMIQFNWLSSLSPGNEQLFRWSSASGRLDGSYNYAGVNDPAVDGLIGEMLSAEQPGDFLSAVRALDRVLLSGGYAIPLFHAPAQWVAHWSHVKRPSFGDARPLWGHSYSLDTWWIERSEPGASQ